MRTVSTDLLRLLLAYAAQVGLDPRGALEAAGVEADRPGTDARIEARAFAAVVDALAVASGDACFGVHLGDWLSQVPASHLVMATVLNSPSVGTGLTRFLKYHALLSDALEPALAVRGSRASILLRAPVHQRLGVHQADALLAMLAGLVRRLAEDARVLEVRFRHAAPARVDGYERVLRAPLRFGAGEDAVTLASADLERPVFLADPELLASLDRHATARLAAVRDGSASGRLQRAVQEALLRTGTAPSLSHAARGLGLAPRTLQARLRREETSFRSVVTHACRALAEELLADPGMTLAEVAYLTGFGDQSAFTNAFKRWTGWTPGAFRRAGAARAAAPAARSRRARSPR